jgi:hypothetical protein
MVWMISVHMYIIMNWMVKRTDDRARAPFLANQGTVEEVFDGREGGSVEVSTTAISAEADDSEDADGDIDGQPTERVSRVLFGLSGSLAFLTKADPGLVASVALGRRAGCAGAGRFRRGRVGGWRGEWTVDSGEDGVVVLRSQ